MSAEERPRELLRSQSFLRLARDTGLSRADVDLLYTRAARYARGQRATEAEDGDVYVGFVRATPYAIPVSALRKIVPLDHVSRVPGGAPHVLGVFSHRGEVLSAHDLDAYLGGSAPGEPSWALIADTPHGGLGLVGDELTTLFGVQPGQVLPLPLTMGARGNGFRGMLSDGTLLIEPKRLLEDPSFFYAFPPKGSA